MMYNAMDESTFQYHLFSDRSGQQSASRPRAAGSSLIRVACDAVHSSGYDRIMPLFDDESVYLGRHIPKDRGNRVLDLGTGSGVLAAIAGKGAGEVIGIDINPKALSYAKATAAINGVAGKCRFLEGDLYDPVKGQSFDLIIANPPFVPIPFEYRLFLSSDGGPDGMAVVRRVLDGAPVHLARGGGLLLLTMSLGNESEVLVRRYLDAAFRVRKVRITTTHIYEETCMEAEAFFRLFEFAPRYAEWRMFLENRSLTHLYYMLHDIRPHDRFQHLEEMNRFPLVQSEFSGSWAGRLNRYRTWLKNKSLSGRPSSKKRSRNTHPE